MSSDVDTYDFAHSPPTPHPTPLPPTDTDFMTIDDTPNRIIIHDLSSEIAEIEAEEASRAESLFLPDIDKKVSSLPHHLLQSGQNHDRHSHMSYTPRPAEDPNTALILYKDPISISVPEEEDVVRKTIIEARKRAREKTAEEQRERERLGQEAETRALQHHRDEGMLDLTSYDAHVEADGQMYEDYDPMDIE